MMYGTLMGLIVSKLVCLNKETIFQPGCPGLPSTLQDLTNTVSLLMSNDIIMSNDMQSCRSLS